MGSQQSLAGDLALAVEQSVMQQLEAGSLLISKDRKHVDLVTENYKQEKFESLLHQYHRVEADP